MSYVLQIDGIHEGLMFLLGVRTGLRLLFTLIRHSWQQPSLADSICTDVLQTAYDVVNNLPPLSLADSSKIPAMGLDCLHQVERL